MTNFINDNSRISFPYALFGLKSSNFLFCVYIFSVFKEYLVYFFYFTSWIMVFREQSAFHRLRHSFSTFFFLSVNQDGLRLFTHEVSHRDISFVNYKSNWFFFHQLFSLFYYAECNMQSRRSYID